MRQILHTSNGALPVRSIGFYLYFYFYFFFHRCIDDYNIITLLANTGDLSFRAKLLQQCVLYVHMVVVYLSEV